MKKQLFFLPFAGGSAHSFDALLPYLKEEYDVYVYEYAGHGARRKEPFYTTLQEAARDAALFVNEKRNGQEFALFGYSFGTIVLYEMMAMNLLKDAPNHIFLASHESPDSYYEATVYGKVDDESLIDILKIKGGMDKFDDTMLSNHFFRDIYLKPIKVDYNLLIDYKMSGNVKFPCNVTIFHAVNDIPRDRIVFWKPYINDESRIIEIGEKHFYIESHKEMLTDYIKDRYIP